MATLRQLIEQNIRKHSDMIETTLKLIQEHSDALHRQAAISNPHNLLIEEVTYFESPIARALNNEIVKSTKCECGSDAVGSPRHSEWCCKYKKD